MSVMIHDSMAVGHRKWTADALRHGDASGLFISPFYTPLEHQVRHPSAQELVSEAKELGAEVVFDATTHAFAYSSTDLLSKYNTWDLWLDGRGLLNTGDRRVAHLDRVTTVQDSLQVPRLAPTLGVDNAIGADADNALAVAELALANDRGAWISVAGRRGFWLSPDLDSYVGAIAGLRANTIIMTFMRDDSTYPVDDHDTAALVGFLRTVRSLSMRSRVIVAHGDLTGLLAVVAGADTVGSGWHGRQRTFGPGTHQRNDPEDIRRTARWFTYEKLLARLHRNEHELLERHERALCEHLYEGPAATEEIDRHRHHLSSIGSIRNDLVACASISDRVGNMRTRYAEAANYLNDFSRLYSRDFTMRRENHIDAQLAALNAFASAEGL